jgi:hypothetical protein
MDSALRGCAATSAIRRQDERAGDVVVHFPRAGFLVTPA